MQLLLHCMAPFLGTLVLREKNETVNSILYTVLQSPWQITLYILAVDTVAGTAVTMVKVDNEVYLVEDVDFALACSGVAMLNLYVSVLIYILQLLVLQFSCSTLLSWRP